MEVTLDQISKKDFQAYENVRVSGVTNMYNRPLVMSLARITEPVYMAILENYPVLCKKWPNARDLGEK